MHPLFHPLFAQYIKFFNEHEDYFECHEVLEEYWKEVAPKDKTHPLTSWILLSTGMYHWRRGNINGAKRSLVSSQKRMQLNPSSPFYEGIDLPQVTEQINQSIDYIDQGIPFQSFKISIVSHDLNAEIDKQPSLISLTGDHLIHKHMLRDRSEILKARENKRRNRH
ncbi:DUF309 domain-containing protein [Paenisporosarcina sp. TG20]|uniref:DUF309 domain-containing protein n=1 Tax=Paenisporosarcina sp. TG20 TaxID=1211706 RepID=UPI0002FD4809|nr:DUF309 domain-containing protein [Paenisporosarcina sp. TG20]